MNWNNFLSKDPRYAHLGVLQGTVSGIYDLSKIPKDTKILDITTPLKKYKLAYSNLYSLENNKTIEAIRLSEISHERLEVFATLPNLKYLHISVNKQAEIPNLSPLKSLQVLVLSGIEKVNDISFIKNIESLQTLYIYGINNLYDLSPLETLTQLKELTLDHGKNNGTGKAIKSMTPISKLVNLEYLDFILNVENKNYSVDPLLTLKNLSHLRVLPRYLKQGRMQLISENLPLVKIA